MKPARMKNPAMVLPGAMQAIQGLLKSAGKGGVPSKTLELVHLRTSQINGCSACVDAGARSAKKAGEADERLFAVAAWREAPYFSDAERAALALAESATRLSDRADASIGRGLGRGRPALRRAGACGHRPNDRCHEPVQPSERNHPAAGWPELGLISPAALRCQPERRRLARFSVC